MGNFYCDFTTRGPSVDEIEQALRRHRRVAYITPTVNGNTVIFDKASNELDQLEIDTLGEMLSRELNCVTIAAAVADDDELWIGLYELGELRIEYDSRGACRGAGAFSRAMGKGWKAPIVWLILHWPYMIFESWRHALLARALGIPGWCVASGFGYIEEDELPE
jgi:hypothetical protein